ncbi:hypothetical protein IAR55_004222 [Kwoniella newhampshirensis]|uniref:Uncharacterized protein n=1 Tax=Kwoniella newhampshirensis TaxID=1651941 RepID=A0AAW0Z1B0_9TREE
MAFRPTLQERVDKESRNRLVQLAAVQRAPTVDLEAEGWLPSQSSAVGSEGRWSIDQPPYTLLGRMTGGPEDDDGGALRKAFIFPPRSPASDHSFELPSDPPSVEEEEEEGEEQEQQEQQEQQDVLSPDNSPPPLPLHRQLRRGRGEDSSAEQVREGDIAAVLLRQPDRKKSKQNLSPNASPFHPARTPDRLTHISDSIHPQELLPHSSPPPPPRQAARKSLGPTRPARQRRSPHPDAARPVPPYIGAPPFPAPQFPAPPVPPAFPAPPAPHPGQFGMVPPYGYPPYSYQPGQPVFIGELETLRMDNSKMMEERREDNRRNAELLAAQKEEDARKLTEERHGRAEDAARYKEQIRKMEEDMAVIKEMLGLTSAADARPHPNRAPLPTLMDRVSTLEHVSQDLARHTLGYDSTLGRTSRRVDRLDDTVLDESTGLVKGVKELTDMSASIISHVKDLTDNASTISTLGTTIGILDTTVSGLSEKGFVFDEKTGLTHAVQRIDASLTHESSRLSVLSATVDDISGKVSGEQGLVSRVQEAQQKGSQVHDVIHNVETGLIERVRVINKRLDDQKGPMTSLSDKVENLSKKVEGEGGLIERMERVVTRGDELHQAVHDGTSGLEVRLEQVSKKGNELHKAVHDEKTGLATTLAEVRSKGDDLHRMIYDNSTGLATRLDQARKHPPRRGASSGGSR